MTATSLATSGWLCDPAGQTIIIIEAPAFIRLEAKSRSLASLATVGRSLFSLTSALREQASLRSGLRVMHTLRSESRALAVLRAECGVQMSDLLLEPLKIGDSWIQPFEFVDDAGDGIDLTDTVLRVTIRSSPGVSPSLAFLSTYLDGGVVIDSDQVANAGKFIAQLEPYQTETFPAQTRVCGDVELTSKGAVVAVTGTADVVAGSTTITVGTLNAALLRQGHLVEVGTNLLAATSVDTAAGTIETDYVWPLTQLGLTLSAWRGVRQTKSWSMQTSMPTTQA
jgi:hypothetical protein